MFFWNFLAFSMIHWTLGLTASSSVFRASLVAQMVKRLPTMPETRVQSLDQEAPLEKEMATHSSILAWKIPWRKEPSRLQSTGSQRVGHDWATSLYWTLLLTGRFYSHLYFVLAKNLSGKLPWDWVRKFNFIIQEKAGHCCSRLKLLYLQSFTSNESDALISI